MAGYKARISHISATNFFETKLCPETDSAGLKTSKTAIIISLGTRPADAPARVRRRRGFVPNIPN